MGSSRSAAPTNSSTPTSRRSLLPAGSASPAASQGADGVQDAGRSDPSNATGQTALGEAATRPRACVFLVAQSCLLRESLSRLLHSRIYFSVVGSSGYTQETLQGIVSSGCDLVVLDSGTAAISELRFIRDAVELVPGLRVVLIGMEDDEALFLSAVRAGAVGYVLNDASALDVVNALRAVAEGEAVCPPRLCLALFKYVSHEASCWPTLRVRMRLGLTRRQQQIVHLIAEGLTNKEIASRLFLSEQTVKNHIHRMLQRLEADDRLEVVQRVREQGVFL